MRFFSSVVLSILWTSLGVCQNTISLSVGQSHLVSGSGKVWVQNGRIIRASEEGIQLRLKAIRSGFSLLRVGSKEYSVFVTTSDQHMTLKALSAKTDKTLGLQTALIDGKVSITGQIFRPSDWDLLYQTCTKITCDYEMVAKIPDRLKTEVKKWIRNRAKSEGIHSYKLIGISPFKVFISSKASEKARSRQFFNRLGITVSESSQSLDLAPLVRVKITVAEVKKNNSLNYGIQWPTSIEAQLFPNVQPTAKATLQMLEQDGQNRILATPNILCRSGKEAEFLAGGEFPIKIINQQMQDVVWKRYGVLLRVKPLADESGRMSISLETEVSSIDNDRTVDGIPGLFTNRIQSHFDLTEPRIIALSGLLKSEEGSSTQGIPGFSRLPILGSLFGSKDFKENKSELVIFVYPEIVDEEEGVL